MENFEHTEKVSTFTDCQLNLLWSIKFSKVDGGLSFELVMQLWEICA